MTEKAYIGYTRSLHNCICDPDILSFKTIINYRGLKLNTHLLYDNIYPNCLLSVIPMFHENTDKVKLLEKINARYRGNIQQFYVYLHDKNKYVIDKRLPLLFSKL